MSALHSRLQPNLLDSRANVVINLLPLEFDAPPERGQGLVNVVIQNTGIEGCNKSSIKPSLPAIVPLAVHQQEPEDLLALVQK